MLREIAEALEAMTAVQPLVLVLEDLHWSDPSTLELLSFVARRSQPARLLVLGTYRPVDVLANGHPLRGVIQELQLHRHCEELPLGFLTEEQIAQYLEERIHAGAHDHALLQKLASSIHRRTEGNPLFMVNIVEALLMQGLLDSRQIENSTPTTIQQMIERQFDHLPPAEQHLLEVASVAGAEFSAAAVAAGASVEVAEVETHCTALARREQFLWRSGQSHWPDGTVAGRYRFRHALYQDVIYDRVPAHQKAEYHKRIGERAERAYSQRSGEIASELTVHFERAHDYPKTIRYLEQAGKTAIRRNAHGEAITHLTKGLTLLKDLPETIERDRQELSLQVALGGQLLATKGFGAPEVGVTYTRARELCHRLGDTSQLFHVLWGLAAFHTVRTEYQQTYDLGQQLLTLAQSQHDLALLVEAHYVVGQTFYFLGNFPLCREHLGEVMRLYDRRQHHSLAFLYGYDPGVMSQSMLATTLWLLGYPDQALKMGSEAVALAQDLSHPSSLAFARVHAGGVHTLRGEQQAAQEYATALTLPAGQGFALMSALGTILQGHLLAEQGKKKEGLALILQGLDAHKATGADHRRPRFFSLLAWGYGEIGRPEEGLTQVDRAFAVMAKTGERQWEAELYRLKGELLLTQEIKRQKAKGKKQK
jgi:predicted ATPase